MSADEHIQAFECTQSDFSQCIFHINIRSLRQNFDNLQTLIFSSSRKPAVICLTETWLTDDDDVNFYALDGYTFFSKPRGTRGGGVGMYVLNEINCSMIQNIQCGEILSINCILNQKTLQISVIYNPPDKSKPQFCDELDSFLESISTRNSHALILGDFNIDILNNTNTGNLYRNIVHQNGFQMLISQPTRETTTTKTCLDHIFTNSIDVFESGVVLKHNITDHYPVYCKLSTRIEAPKSEEVSQWDLSFLRNDDAKLRFLFLLQQKLESSSIYNDPNPESSLKTFFDILYETTNKFACIKSSSCTKRSICPWISNKIKNAITKKNHLFQKSLNNPLDPSLSQKYCRQRNLVTSMIRNAKKQYYSDKIDSSIHDKKQLFRNINEMCGRNNKKAGAQKLSKDGVEITNPRDIANLFNQSFVEIGPKLANQIPPVDLNPCASIPIQQQSMFTACVKENEIRQIIAKLKNKKSTGFDNIPSHLLKETDVIIAPFLVALVNKTLTTGIFPNSLKTARVVPVFKEGQSSEPLNYRPISILSTLSKIYEKVIYNRLYGYFDHFDLFYKNQFGFRPKRNTVDAIAEFLEKTRTADNDKSYNSCVLIDLKKAFDTIDHKILLAKLERYGVRGPSIELLRSYLADRQTICSNWK